MNIALAEYTYYNASVGTSQTGFVELLLVHSLLGNDYFNAATPKNLKNRVIVFTNELPQENCKIDDGKSFIYLKIGSTDVTAADAAIRTCLSK